MEKQKTIENVKVLLEKYPGLKSPDSRKEAHWTYWQEFEGVGNFGILKQQYIHKLTSPEIIGEVFDELIKNSLKNNKE